MNPAGGDSSEAMWSRPFEGSLSVSPSRRARLNQDFFCAKRNYSGLRGSAYFKLTVDLGFTAALLVQLWGFDGFVNHRLWAVEPLALLLGIR